MSDNNLFNLDNIDREYALRMLAKGYDIEDIAEITGLTIDVVERLSQEMVNDQNPMTISEPYAVLSEDNTILTFYYDDQKVFRNGYSVGPFSFFEKRWGGHSGDIITVVFDETFAHCNTLTSTAFWFDGCRKLVKIKGINNLVTNKVTKMNKMFSGCYSLMFLDVSGFKTGNVTDMSDMFCGCSGLKTLDLSSFDTRNVIDMSGMFSKCSGLESLDFSCFKTDNVTDMIGMFFGCNSLTSLDLSFFNTAKVTNMVCMFYGCHKLKRIFASKLWSTSEAKHSWNMFDECTKLIGGNGTPFNAKCTDHRFASIDIEGQSGYFTKSNLPLEPYAVLSDNNTVLTFYYDDKKKERDGLSIGPFYIDKDYDTLIEYYDMGYITENEFFVSCYHCRKYLEPWDGHSPQITTVIFDESFVNCNTITSTAFWFDGCINLTTIIGIRNLNTENVTTMWRMFADCSSLTNLDISSLKTDKVIFATSMFAGCSGLMSIDLSGFKTGKVVYMDRMFSDCSKLIYLNLSGFRTGNVKDMVCMFRNCSGLSILNLESFNTRNVEFVGGIIDGCSNLERIYVGSKWDLSRCWDADQIGSFYARIDREGTPGYLTDSSDANHLNQG